MALRDHEINMILKWAGVEKAFRILTDDNEVLPTLGSISRDQAIDIINYAYTMGFTDAGNYDRNLNDN